MPARLAPACFLIIAAAAACMLAVLAAAAEWPAVGTDRALWLLSSEMLAPGLISSLALTIYLTREYIVHGGKSNENRSNHR